MKTVLAALLLTIVTTTAFIAGCDSTGVDDELAAADDDPGVDGKADGTGTSTFYTLTGDADHGYSAARVNRSTARCADGAYRSRCRASRLDLAAIGFSATEAADIGQAIAEGRVLMRGKLKKVGAANAFAATEVWVSPWSTEADGVYAVLTDAGVRCFAFPCEGIHERKLNGSARAEIAQVDWPTDVSYHTDADDAALAAALFDGGAIVAGNRGHVTGPGGTKRTRTVTQFFTRLRPAPRACVVSGCSGEVCADESRVSPCIYRPEYACYHEATCETQNDGACGWTHTESLNACIDAAQMQ